MNSEYKSRQGAVHAALFLACMLSAAGPVFAQDAAKPEAVKWRPKDGIYASPGKEFDGECREFGGLVIKLAKKSVGGNEWSCKIDKLTGTAPDAIKLDMTCDDYNLGLSINPNDPNLYERKYKEIMLLKRVNETAISVRKTSNGKFKYPGWRANYCPEEAQRMYLDAEAREKAEAEQKAADEHPWRPQAGVYAMAGADFDNRCLKSGDAIIELAERSISTGADTCSVTFIRNEPNALQLFVTCDTASNTEDVAGNHPEVRPSPVPSRPETVILKKIDDTSVFLQMTKDRKFTDAGAQLSYCGKDAQKIYAQKKAKNE